MSKLTLTTTATQAADGTFTANIQIAGCATHEGALKIALAASTDIDANLSHLKQKDGSYVTASEL